MIMFRNMSIADAAYASESCGKHPPISFSFSSKAHASQENAIGEHRNTLSKTRTTEEANVNTIVVPVAIMWWLERVVRRQTSSIDTLNRQGHAISAISVK